MDESNARTIVRQIAFASSLPQAPGSFIRSLQRPDRVARSPTDVRGLPGAPSTCTTVLPADDRRGATEPAWNGYRLTVACACGVVFERWVTPEEADADLLRLAALN